MTISRAVEKRLLQYIVAVLAFLPVSAGLAGVALGPSFLDTASPWSADLDSHLRFLSGIFLAMGVGWWTCVPRIAEKGGRLRLLALFTVCGGLARLLSLILAGWPSNGHVIGLAMELVVVPLLVVWQMRVERREGRRDP